MSTESSQSGGKKYSGVTVKWWGDANSHSREAALRLQLMATTFEKETGATVEHSADSYSDITGQKWINRFKQGDYPHLIDTTFPHQGPFAEGGWLEPFPSYKDQLSDTILSNLEWLYPKMESTWKGFADIVDGSPKVVSPARGGNALDPFVARLDHFEEAGLDPKEDFPPKNYEHLIEVATQLQENGPGDWGFQIFGSAFDITDEIVPGWYAAEGGDQGMFLNNDWSASTYDSDAWKKVFKQYVDVFRKHGLSNPGTPNYADESTVPALASGSISMSQINITNHPDVKAQMKQLIADGNFMYGMPWTGKTGSTAYQAHYPLGITKAPEGADKQKWARQQEAAVELLEYWFHKEFQTNMFQNLGATPARADAIEDLPETPSKVNEVGSKAFKNAKYTTPAHKNLPSILYGDPTAPMQNALRGQISPEDACDKAAEIVNNQLL